MTVQNQNVKNVYRGNGSTTVFPFTFAINESHPEYIHVYITNDGGKAAETTDFTCDMETRTITYPKVSSSAPKLSATQRLTIYRLLPYEQNLNLVNQGPFFSEDVETQLDDLEMQIQQLSENLVRCFQIGIEALDFDMTMELEPGKVICVNSEGNGFEAREALMEVNGHWDGEGRRIESVADPAAAQDVVTKKYVDTLTDNNFMKLQPDGTAWEGRNLPIGNVAGPALVKDAATKDYVDRILAGYSGYGERLAIFDNVAQMQAAELVPSQVAVTLGYWDVNDGGAGVYTIRDIGADTPDGGSIIEITGTDYVAELIPNGAVNVKQFGAYGDKTHDDTQAFKNATAYAERGWDDTIVDRPMPVILVPYGAYKLTDTWKISCPCIVDAVGDIVYDGEHDRACVEVGGAVWSRLIAGSEFRFNTIAELSAYNNNDYEDGNHYFSNDNFVGLKTINLGYCKISFERIVNFAVGFVALAKDGDGWYFNEVVGKQIQNCQCSFVIESENGGWPNANKVSDIFFRTSSSIANNTSYHFYHIKTKRTNSTYGANSWLFENLRFEGNSTGNMISIYLGLCYGFKFRNYRAEVYNKQSLNFCVIDCTTVINNATNNIVFETSQVDYGIISYENLNLSSRYALSEICRKNLVWHEIAHLDQADIVDNILPIQSNKMALKKFRALTSAYDMSNILTGNGGVLHEGAYDSPIINTDGISIYSYICCYVRLLADNTSIKVETDAMISMRIYDANGDVIDGGTEYCDGILGSVYKARPYGDGRFLVGPNNNNNINIKEFSVSNPSAKYLVIYFYGNATRRVNFFHLYADKFNTVATFNLDGINAYVTNAIPTEKSLDRVGTKIFRTVGTNAYYQLEKQQDNTLAWVLH